MDMKRDYYEDVQFFTSGTIAFWLSRISPMRFTSSSRRFTLARTEVLRSTPW